MPHGTERNTVDHYARQSLIVKLKIPRDRIAAPSVMASEALDLMQREYGARKRIEADISVPVARPPALVDQQATDPSTSNLKDTSTYAESLQQRIDHEVSVEAVTQKEHSTPTTTNSTIEHHQPDWEAALSSDPHHAVLNGEGADTALLQSSCTPSRPQFSQAPQKSVLPSAPVLSAPAGRPIVAVAHSNPVSQRQHGRHDEPTRASGNTDAGFGEHDQAPLTLTSFTGTAIRPEIVQALREEVAAFRKGVPQSINQQSASTSACSIEITPHLKAMEGLANVEQHASTGSIQAAPSTLAMQEEANTQKGVVSHRQASESPHVDATTLPDHALTASLEDPPSCMATRSAGDGAEHDTLSPNAAADISARQLSPHETSAEEEVAITAEVKSTAEATSRCGIIPPSGAELMAAELSQTKATTTPETTSAAATTYAADTSPAGATSSAEVVMASDLALTAETSSIAGTASEVELEDVKPGYDPAPSVSSHAKGTPSMESSAFLSPTPMDLNSHAAMSHVTTDRLILVDWKVKGDEGATVSRLTKYNPKMWQAFKGDMPASFSGKRFVGLKRTMVSMSAAEVLEHYGESIASDGIEDCLEFLADEAFGEDESVERPWRKATVMMSD